MWHVDRKVTEVGKQARLPPLFQTRVELTLAPITAHLASLTSLATAGDEMADSLAIKGVDWIDACVDLHA